MGRGAKNRIKISELNDTRVNGSEWYGFGKPVAGHGYGYIIKYPCTRQVPLRLTPNYSNVAQFSGQQ
jgi:hypothetical protein